MSPVAGGCVRNPITPEEPNPQYHDSNGDTCFPGRGAGTNFMYFDARLHLIGTEEFTPGLTVGVGRRLNNFVNTSLIVDGSYASSGGVRNGGYVGVGAAIGITSPEEAGPFVTYMGYVNFTQDGSPIYVNRLAIGLNIYNMDGSGTFDLKLNMLDLQVPISLDRGVAGGLAIFVTSVGGNINF